MLKVSAFYLEKQKSFIPKNIHMISAIVSKWTEIVSTDGVCCPNFQQRFCISPEHPTLTHTAKPANRAGLLAVQKAYKINDNSEKAQR